MSGKKMIYLGIAMTIFVSCYFGWKLTARTAYESASYTILEADGNIEIRNYPDLMLATTGMNENTTDDDSSFMRLFRYISGANKSEQNISMTTPVFMERDSQNEPGQMGFVLPESMQQPPQPANENVELQKRTGGRFAVIRFSGRMNRETISHAKQKLQKWMSEKLLNGTNEAEFAGYDPPWTPGPFRRNEILIRLE